LESQGQSNKRLTTGRVPYPAFLTSTNTPLIHHHFSVRLGADFGVCLKLMAMAGFSLGSALNVVIVFNVGASSLGTQLLAYTYAGDFYPSTIRSAGVGFASGAGRFGSIVAPVLIGWLVSLNLPFKQNLIVISVAGLIGALAVTLINQSQVDSTQAKKMPALSAVICIVPPNFLRAIPMIKNRLSKPYLPPELLSRTIDWAITSRRSIRAFRQDPVSHDDIEGILDVARFSATGVNMQPWRVHVVTGEIKSLLSSAIEEVDNDPELSQGLEDSYEYYPREWTSPYIDRRRQLGWELYGLLGITKGEKKRMHQQHGRNYRFFDAPVGLIFTIDRVLQEGSLLDYGMFLQSVMIAARGRGLHTCPQAAFLKYHQVISEILSIPADQMLVCGMSLGYADETRVENSLVTDREPVSAFTTFHHNNKETP